MKTFIFSKKTSLILLTLLISSICFSHSINETEWKFKLEVPSSWSKNVYMDGADKVYEFYSADQNAGIIVRALQVNNQVTLDMLIPLYEQNMLANATRVDLGDITSKNGIPGKQGIYSMDYNGNKLDIAVFYTIQNSKAYMLTALVVSAIAENYRTDIQSITSSFKIDGVGNKPETKSGLSGLAGMVKKQSSSNTNTASTSNNSSIVGRYLFDYSGGDNRTNFNRIFIYADGTYKHEYQPKNSGNYIGGSKGTWKLNGSTLTLHHAGGGVIDTYTVNGKRLTRDTGSGTMVYWKE